MAYKKVADLSGDIPAIAIGGFNKKLKQDNPTSVEGYYLGSRDVPSEKSKTGKAKIHVFKTPKGNQPVWGKTDMDGKLDQVTKGAHVKVEFSGMKKVRTGEMYIYDVFEDEDNAIEEGILTASDPQEDEETETDYNDSGDNYEELPSAQVLQTAKAAADRMAKTKELLSRNKK